MTQPTVCHAAIMAYRTNVQRRYTMSRQTLEDGAGAVILFALIFLWMSL